MSNSLHTPAEALLDPMLTAEQVAESRLTAQLEASEERFRQLFLQEQRRARHLSLINEVQKCALATRGTESFLSQVTRAIGSHFPDCDVSFYLVSNSRYGTTLHALVPSWTDTDTSDMVVVAGSGEHGLGLPSGTRRTQWDLSEDDGHSPFHPEALSHLRVPLVIEHENVGVILVQSRDADVLDARDVAALQTASAIIAAHLQNLRLYNNMYEANDFNQNLLNSMLHSMLVVDAQGRIQFVNERLLQIFGLSRESLRHQSFETIFGDGASRHHHLSEVIQSVLETGEGKEIPEVHVWTPDGAQIFDLRLFRVYYRGEAEAAVLLINLTQRWRKTYQLQLMHEIGRLFQSSLDIDRVLWTVLTCITAGSALGFNRAFVFLFDESKDRECLEGRMALGPSSSDEASRIWSEISQRELTLAELLEQDAPRRLQLTPLQERTRALQISVDNPFFPALQRALATKTALHATRDQLISFDGPVCDAIPIEAATTEAQRAAELFSASEIAVAPLIAKERLVGVVFADNLYSGSPIEPDDVQLLDTLAQQAGLTIDNALTYQDLQGAQKELVAAERLAVIGDMAARVSHEIRNPLATIGGFARSVLKKPTDVDSVERKTGIIVKEVTRLEELLTDLLDMARPRALNSQLENINEVVEHAILLAEADIRAVNAAVERNLAPDLPPIPFDRSRILQALLNTIRNGAQAMRDGGTLRVSTTLGHPNPDLPAMVQIKVADTGVGISPRALRQVFDPFFSTKVSGSGLGLAVTKRIIEEHGGVIDVESEEGHGTTFIFSLPLRKEPETLTQGP